MFNNARDTIIVRPSVHRGAPFGVPADGVIIADQATVAPTVWSAEEPY